MLLVDAFRFFFRWLERCRNAHTRKDQALFPIIQGGLDFSLRKKCAAAMVQQAETGIAIGGLSGGKLLLFFFLSMKLTTIFLCVLSIIKIWWKMI